MSLLNVHPALALGTLTLAFGGWVTYEAVRPTKVNDAQLGPVASRGERVHAESRHEAVLYKLHIGMPRPMVEHLLAGLSASEPEPVDLSSGAPVVRAQYQVQLRHPLPHLAPQSPSFRPGLQTLTLEFDGRVPGHPLVRAEFKPLDGASELHATGECPTSLPVAR